MTRYEQIKLEIEKKEKELDYLQRKSEVCAMGKSDFAEIDALVDEINELKDKLSNMSIEECEELVDTEDAE